MKTVCFGLYNQLTRRAKEYQQHVQAITDFSLNQFVGHYNHKNTQHAQSVVTANDLDSLLNLCDHANTDFAFIVAYGFRSCCPELMFEIIDHMIENDYCALAHILQDEKKEKGYYSLHHQCIMINMNQWRQAGKPKFGQAGGYRYNLTGVSRDPDNFHDDYTPGWIRSAEHVINYVGYLREGWHFISCMLASGFAIGNFTQSMRDQKLHLYPDFGDALEQKLAGKDVVLQEPNQKHFMNMVSFDNFQNSVYVFNTDPMIKDHIQYDQHTPLGSIYCVAAGFKPLQLMNSCAWDASTRMVYIDYSDSALHFKQWLVENWNGVDYLRAINTYQTDVDTTFRPVWFVGKDYFNEWNRTMEIFGGLEAWLSLWDRYRCLEHQYLKINLYDQYEQLIDDMQQHGESNNLLWFSNSFYTEACLANFQLTQLNKYYQDFIRRVCAVNHSLQICGTNNQGQPAWFHHGTIK